MMIRLLLYYLLQCIRLPLLLLKILIQTCIQTVVGLRKTLYILLRPRTLWVVVILVCGTIVFFEIWISLNLNHNQDASSQIGLVSQSTGLSESFEDLIPTICGSNLTAKLPPIS